MVYKSYYESFVVFLGLLPCWDYRDFVGAHLKFVFAIMEFSVERIIKILMSRICTVVVGTGLHSWALVRSDR